jgi:hypothetical protein
MSLNRKDISTALKHVEMQHRHFSLIAAALRDSKPTGQIGLEMIQWQFTVHNFVVICRSSNPRFDRERFLAACNYQRANP